MEAATQVALEGLATAPDAEPFLSTFVRPCLEINTSFGEVELAEALFGDLVGLAVRAFELPHELLDEDRWHV
ncbi:MAG: hypothetical protein M0000_07240, partial [Actinomycetota bacterium]|nr:hypothetical protein [Actinomycetota bacterium]